MVDWWTLVSLSLLQERCALSGDSFEMGLSALHQGLRPDRSLEMTSPRTRLQGAVLEATPRGLHHGSSRRAAEHRDPAWLSRPFIQC